MPAPRNWPLVCLQELTTGSYRTGSQWLLSVYPESTYMFSTVSRPAYLCTHRSWPAYLCTHRSWPAYLCTHRSWPAYLCTHRPWPAYLCMSARKTWPPSRWDSRTWCRPTRRSRKRKGWKQQRPYFRSRIRIKYIYSTYMYNFIRSLLLQPRCVAKLPRNYTVPNISLRFRDRQLM